jgi:hypothetical protein
MIAPAGVGGGAAAAGVGAVDDVVVDERGAVEKFNDGSKTDGAGSVATGVSVAEKEQRRTQAFAATTKKIAGDFADGLVGRGALAREFLFDEDQIVANQIKNFFNRQKRDGTSPWPALQSAFPCSWDA